MESCKVEITALVNSMFGELVLPTHPIRLNERGHISVQRDTQQFMYCPDADRALRAYLINHFSQNTLNSLSQEDADILAQLIIQDFVRNNNARTCTASTFAEFITSEEAQKDILLQRVKQEKDKQQQQAGEKQEQKSWKNLLVNTGIGAAIAGTLLAGSCRKKPDDNTPPKPDISQSR